MSYVFIRTRKRSQLRIEDNDGFLRLLYIPTSKKIRYRNTKMPLSDTQTTTEKLYHVALLDVSCRRHRLNIHALLGNLALQKCNISSAPVQEERTRSKSRVKTYHTVLLIRSSHGRRRTPCGGLGVVWMRRGRRLIAATAWRRDGDGDGRRMWETSGLRVGLRLDKKRHESKAYKASSKSRC
jgi:hypothetical protein